MPDHCKDPGKVLRRAMIDNFAIESTAMDSEGKSLRHLNLVQEETWPDLKSWELFFVSLLKDTGKP